jgi:uncharacterized protein (TIGR03437 family)
MLAMRIALAMAVCGLRLAAASATDYGAPSITSASLVNAATGAAVLAPYSICALYGTGLFLDGTAVATGGSVVPDTLAGVTVLIGSAPAGVFYLSANQINLLIPNSIGPGSYTIRVVRDGVSSPAVPIVIQEVAPGLFAAPPGFVVAQHADGTAVTDTSPAVPGEVVVFYATGLGRTQPDPSDRSVAPAAAPIADLADFQVLLDGVPIDPSMVEYAGAAPLNAGLYQVNVLLPDNLSATNPEVRLSVTGVMSPPGLNLITGVVTSPQDGSVKDAASNR